MLEHLAELARIKLDPAVEDKMIADLDKILGHFNELKDVKTPPEMPIRASKTPIRPDEPFATDRFANQTGLTDQFPEQDRGYLKLPPVFGE